ncbi:MAG: methyltransferase domain-containing protein [Thermodesulfovibrio sp.]|nr:methyltransferase domain-containing protein [Thermodesulfovibrio sp.]
MKTFNVKAVVKLGLSRVLFYFYKLKYRSAEVYKPPTETELMRIEEEFQQQGIVLHYLYIDTADYEKFKKVFKFPADYYANSPVREEKFLEHYVSYKLLDLERREVYIDIAACNSPWAKVLRDHGINAYALDIQEQYMYSDFEYYLVQDATKTNFPRCSIDSASLQCAYEMFLGNDDIKLIYELKRILKPSGKVIILPLYMHTHNCHYSSPEFYGKGFGDPDSKEYINWDCWGIPASRKYSVSKLKKRILDLVSELGMSYKVYVLKNKREIADCIYLHFILEISKDFNYDTSQ